MDRDVDTSPIAPALAAFFDDVLDQSVEQLNFKAIVDGLGEVLNAVRSQRKPVGGPAGCFAVSGVLPVAKMRAVTGRVDGLTTRAPLREA
eukprot:1153553-Pelagomonas_calceolata.AAC.11